MSSEPTAIHGSWPAKPTGLCNLDYVERYRSLLRANLPPDWPDFGRFFGVMQRLETLADMLGTHMRDRSGPVLNVGCGPFATELFVAALQTPTVHCFDYTAEFGPFLHVFRADGHLANVTFRQADALTVEYPRSSFDLVIIHDVLYETGLDMAVLLRRFNPVLRPGGLLFLDFVNRRTERLWRLAGGRQAFKRYDPADVTRIIAETGYEVVDWRPTYGIQHWSKWILNATLRTVIGQSNAYAVMIRKTGVETA